MTVQSKRLVPFKVTAVVTRHVNRPVAVPGVTIVVRPSAVAVIHAHAARDVPLAKAFYITRSTTFFTVLIGCVIWIGAANLTI